ncbi:MAG TPA: S1 RNA-binding domain-containing protein [Phycisphaerae bacterium]|nr:S1 RNA-binding domain-containing protein [Phycisphaerae bacterium]
MDPRSDSVEGDIGKTPNAGSEAGTPQTPPQGGDTPSLTPDQGAQAPAPPRPARPADIAASLVVNDDKDLDRAVEEAMRGFTTEDISAADVAAKGPAVDEPSPGDLLTGRIANIGSEDILIDFGGKSLGAMPLADFEKDERYAVGDSVQVLVVGKDERGGLLSVSRRKAKRELILRNLKVGLVVEAHVTGMNKGGLEVDIEGLRGFVPASQVDLYFMKDISDLLGKVIRAEVTRFDLDDDRENIVLSRRKVLVREEDERKEKAFQEIQAGQIRHGVVRNVTDYGAFVDIGGIDGLLHVTDMSWGRVNKPEEVVKVGDEIDVKVIKVNAEKKKISLSLKQTKPDPWLNAAERYSPNQRLSGRVVRLENFGAFVEIEPGLDGLIPISELSWTKRIRHPSEILKEGDIIEVSIMSMDVAKKRMSLSLKQLAEDPWANVTQRYTEGAKVKGKVVRTTDFGAFVQLEEGIDGLIHISELSEERVRAVTDKVQPGQEVEVRILGVDPEAKKISLSLRKPPTGPTPEEIARMEAERAAAEARRKPAKRRRGGITVDWDDGGLSLGSLDPSKFGR